MNRPLDDSARGADPRSLWQRAPLWRATVIAASACTVGAIALGVMDRPAKPAPGPLPPPAVVAGEAPPPVAPTPAAPLMPAAPAPIDGGGPEKAPAPAPTPTPTPTPTSVTSADEERAQAACHPGLIRAPDMPAIASTDETAHMKFHFWVNGAGVVVRDQFVGGTLGTEAERAAERAYLYQLQFSIPDADCRNRQMQLTGDFFEARNRFGNWETFVRLRPHLSFDPNGVLHVSD